jgi:uncharacterized phage protein (TIGR01671 family)
MQRIIKFRGKRIDNREWVFGNGVVVVDEDYVAIPKTKDVTSAHYAIKLVKIVPETAGQFTGLKDKNKVEIYEGDILQFIGGTCDILPCGLYGYQHYSIGQILIVQYLDTGFTLRKPELIDKDMPNLVGNVDQYAFWNHQRSFKAIGNCFDNPELLNPPQEGVLNMTDPNIKTEEVAAPVTETEQEQVPGTPAVIEPDTEETE